MQTNGKDIYVFGKDFGRGGSIIYDKLGLKATKLTQEKAINQGPGYASISLEKLPDFAGDYIFMGPWQAGGDEKACLTAQSGRTSMPSNKTMSTALIRSASISQTRSHLKASSTTSQKA